MAALLHVFGRRYSWPARTWNGGAWIAFVLWDHAVKPREPSRCRASLPTSRSSSFLVELVHWAVPTVAGHTPPWDKPPKQGVTVVRPEWVWDTFKEGRELSCDDYGLRPFEGLRITMTGLSMGEHHTVRAP